MKALVSNMTTGPETPREYLSEPDATVPDVNLIAAELKIGASELIALLTSLGNNPFLVLDSTSILTQQQVDYARNHFGIKTHVAAASQHHFEDTADEPLGNDDITAIFGSSASALRTNRASSSSKRGADAEWAMRGFDSEAQQLWVAGGIPLNRPDLAVQAIGLGLKSEEMSVLLYDRTVATRLYRGEDPTSVVASLRRLQSRKSVA